jgi:peptidoglycan-N-acetylmuramic acid deacetylase
MNGVFMKTEWVIKDNQNKRYGTKTGKNVHPAKYVYTAVTLVFMCAMFFLGRSIAEALEKISPTAGSAARTTELSASMLEAENWGLGFGADGTRPTGNATEEQLKEYNAYFIGPEAENDEKKLYLTFDCGYENGNTEAILDALKKHNASATFFVVGHYLETAPDLVKRMVSEGHTVGNHTYHHPDMSSISDIESFRQELESVSLLYKEIVGEDMPMYYRPPQGKYSAENLEMAKELGYSTFFWSLAYVDWNVDDQPTHDEAFSKLTKRVHPGAVVLLHVTSKTNGEILDELLCKWEDMGYTFGTLDELCGR